ncbi:MAG: site-specific DNA-methyltransferase [Lachnospiraceae bacterium]|nr:site-specific DNA-methyltransferase [Lachnospiraceae bacterium]
MIKVIKQYVDKNMALYNGDSAEILKGIPDDYVHFMIYSPPFASLYVYSNSERDLGNCKTLSEFYTQFEYIVKQLYRCLMPGRLMAVHCMNLPTTKGRDGFIGLRDFRGDLIKLFESVGFLYHSEVCIWKDPVVQMQRTKALGLLHKQIKKDSAMSRQGLPEYLVIMRKPGDNPEPITHTNDTFPVSEWQKYASPVWMDINPSDTLQSKSCRDEKDEKHICPLQLSVIRRAIDLWSNPGETVLTPFMGIGSEAYVALERERKAIGIELKSSWFEQAVKNCKEITHRSTQIAFY